MDPTYDLLAELQAPCTPGQPCSHQWGEWLEKAPGLHSVTCAEDITVLVVDNEGTEKPATSSGQVLVTSTPRWLGLPKCDRHNRAFEVGREGFRALMQARRP